MVTVDKKLTELVIGAAYEVHSMLGPGRLESSYRECLFYELRKLNLHVEKEKPVPLVYKEVKLEHGYRLDILVESQLVLEVKSVDGLAPVHFQQLLSYLKFGNFSLGLLINFNIVSLKNGIKRVAN